MSLPEVLLILREDQKRESARALMALQSQALTAFAVWDKESGRKLEQLRRSLGESLYPQVGDAKQLVGVLSSWGASAEDIR
jgi:hypothetical protein